MWVEISLTAFWFVFSAGYAAVRIHKTLEERGGGGVLRCVPHTDSQPPWQAMNKKTWRLSSG